MKRPVEGMGSGTYTRIPTFGDRSGGGGAAGVGALGGWLRGWLGGWGCPVALLSPCPAQPLPHPAPALLSPSPVLWPLARATAGWPGGSGPNGTQGAPRCTLELKVRRLYYHLVTIYAAPATRSLFGARSGKVAPKRVWSAKVRFGVPKPSI